MIGGDLTQWLKLIRLRFTILVGWFTGDFLDDCQRLFDDLIFSRFLIKFIDAVVGTYYPIIIVNSSTSPTELITTNWYDSIVVSDKRS